MIFIGVLIYLNLKIKAEDNQKKLMERILQMEKAIVWYIRIILFSFFGVVCVMFFEDTYEELIVKEENTGGLWVAMMMAQTFYLVLIFLFYRVLKFVYQKLIYGRVLKRLKTNYAELSKLEETNV